MKNVLISAFEPFGVYPANSSQLVAEFLARNGVEGFEISTAIFPATIPTENRGELLVERALKMRASAILSLGMASEKKGLCIEGWARNAIDNEKYCPPELLGTPVDTGAAYGSKLPLNLRPWHMKEFVLACQTAGIPMEYSGDSGGFCCNHLMWQTRKANSDTETEGVAMRYLFVHLPCSPEAVADKEAFASAGKVSLPVHRMAKGIELLLRGASL